MLAFRPNVIAKQFLTLAPKVVAYPLAVVPFKLKSEVLSRLLTLLLAEQAEDQELDFLTHRWVAVQITDLNLSFEVSYDNGWQVREPQAAEVTFSGNSAELLLVAAAKEDPDTLFFQRKLCIEGDTELGLEVKNLLLGVEFDSMPAPLRMSIEKLAEILLALQMKANTQAASLS